MYKRTKSLGIVFCVSSFRIHYSSYQLCVVYYFHVKIRQTFIVVFSILSFSFFSSSLPNCLVFMLCLIRKKSNFFASWNKIDLATRNVLLIKINFFEFNKFINYQLIRSVRGEIKRSKGFLGSLVSKSFPGVWELIIIGILLIFRCLGSVTFKLFATGLAKTDFNTFLT